MGGFGSWAGLVPSRVATFLGVVRPYPKLKLLGSTVLSAGAAKRSLL